MNDLNAALFAGAEGAAEAFGLSDCPCGCWTCVTEFKKDQPLMERITMPFIVCDVCGNKRCPRATHHDNACTGSNEVYQKGSRYGGLEGQEWI